MRPDDAFGDEHDPPMDRSGLMLFVTAVVASWLAVWGLWRACVALVWL